MTRRRLSRAYRLGVAFAQAHRMAAEARLSHACWLHRWERESRLRAVFCRASFEHHVMREAERGIAAAEALVEDR